MPGKKNSIHSKVYDNAKKIKKTVDSLQKPNGELMSTALNMLENLKNVKSGQNPTMVDAVGASNLAQAYKEVAQAFKKPTDDPCSLAYEDQTEEERGSCACKVPVEQRTPQQLHDCAFWTALQNALTAPEVPIAAASEDFSFEVVVDVGAGDGTDVIDGGAFPTA